MSLKIFGTIVAAEHSTVAFFEKELAIIEKKEPEIATVISAGIKYCTPVINIALVAAGAGGVVPEVDAVLAEVQKDLLVVSSVVYDFGPTPTAASMFASIKTNLSDLLAAGHLKSTTATNAVNKVINEVGLMGTAVETAAAGIKDSTTKSPSTPVD